MIHLPTKRDLIEIMPQSVKVVVLVPQNFIIELSNIGLKSFLKKFNRNEIKNTMVDFYQKHLNQWIRLTLFSHFLTYLCLAMFYQSYQ